MTGRTALVTGVAGQDGVYLARLLLSEGTTVVGTARARSQSVERMRPYLEGVLLERNDVRDTEGFRQILRVYRPDEIYNLAGFTSVGMSWDHGDLARATNGDAVPGLLEAARNVVPECRFLQAGSCEEHGPAAHSPYARGKARARLAVEEDRARHGQFACVATLHHHESPLRQRHFVTRRMTRAAAEIRLGRATRVKLGNLRLARDWGWAPDFTRAMPLMLRQDAPEDLVIATGTAHTVRELVEAAFSAAGVDNPWAHVERDLAVTRAPGPAQVGDPAAARARLGWGPTTSFEEMVARMVAADLERIRSGVEEATGYLAD